MSHLINITGCIKYNDYQTATKHMRRACEELSQEKYESLVNDLDEKFPTLFRHEDFKEFKRGITTLSDWKKQLEDAISRGDDDTAKKIYYDNLRGRVDYDDKAFHERLGRIQKEGRIKYLETHIKSNLSKLEKELALDTYTYLEHIDKPFSRRVQTEKGNFYITTGYHPDLSIIGGRQSGPARHMHWHHELAQNVLSVELGECGVYGLVSLIGNYKPIDTDLTDVSYFTKLGRHHFSSALEALTDTQSTLVRKIDADNFMKMKEVIPTASQIKAIYADGNYIIDGPAGTGKSTTLLQKILILTEKSGIKRDKVLVLVKHKALVAPFKALLEDMQISDIIISSVEEFLTVHFGNDFNQLSFALFDEAQDAATQLLSTLRSLFDINLPSQEDLNSLPGSFIDNSLLCKEFSNYCELARNIEDKENKKRLREDIVVQKVKESFNLNGKLQKFKNENCSFGNDYDYLKYLTIDKNIMKEFNEINKKYNEAFQKIKQAENAEEEEKKDRLLRELEYHQKEFYDLASKRRGTLTPSSKDNIIIKDYFEKKLNEKVEEYKRQLDDELVVEKKVALAKDNLVSQLDESLKNLSTQCESSKQKIIELSWGDALITKSEFQRRLIGLHGGIDCKKRSYNTIIIDEAQDVPSTFIELISIYTRQVILAGDEAQKENPSGLGAWTNLRKSSPFYQEGTLSIHKLRHNFRQTYELGNISYNYRQLLLGNSVEDLSADYFDNQKGFPIPAIVHKDKFESLIREKLKYIADVFTVKFPLVVICSSHHEQQQTIGLLMGLGIRTSAEDSVGAGSTEVVVITVNEIAGREFPVAISILPDAIEPGTVYIILSRAKFDLTLVIGTDFKMDEYLVRLEQLRMLKVL